MSLYRKGFLKVIIIGDSGVGKTSLLESFNYKKVSKSSKPTIGAEFLKKKVVLEDSSEVNLQLWDTAGQERFQSLCTSFYRGSDCCVLVFDLTSTDSYLNLGKWRQSFINTTGDGSQGIPIILIGNKMDKNRMISRDQVEEEWVKAEKCQAYIEASALKHENVDQAFQKVGVLANEYQMQLRDNDPSSLRHSIINVNQLRNGKGQSQMQKLRNNKTGLSSGSSDQACGC